MLVDVHLDQLDLALGGADGLFEDRRELAARAAPGRPEVDQHRLALRFLDDVLHEGLGRRLLDQIGCCLRACAAALLNYRHDVLASRVCRNVSEFAVLARLEQNARQLNGGLAANFNRAPGVSGPPTPPFGLRPWSTVAEWWTTFDFDAGKRDELPGSCRDRSKIGSNCSVTPWSPDPEVPAFGGQ